MSVQALYPTRERALNVRLLRRAMDAKSHADFEASLEAMAAAMHPSLFAELDWLEKLVPPQQEDGIRKFVDGILLELLPVAVGTRLVEFQVDDDALEAEVEGHRPFYEYTARARPDVVAALGAEYWGRISRTLANPPRPRAVALETAKQAERPRLRAVMAGIEDRRWLPIALATEIQNALARELDHISSRMEAKQFARSVGRRFPHDSLGPVESQADGPVVAGELRSLAELASQRGLHLLSATCLVMAEELLTLDLAARDAFRGERSGGYGPCGSCSMMYASTAILALDPTCPGFFDPQNGTLFLPSNFNVSACPFCGEEARPEAPSMFYSKERGTVIYNAPTLGQFSEEEAVEQFRPMLEQLRAGYLERVSEADRLAFERAAEEFTHNAADFLLAIQMGTTAREEHVYNVISFADGTGMIVDSTKGVMIGLTRSEMAHRGGQAISVEALLARDVTEQGDSVRAAMAAFAAKDVAGARAMLERLHARFPRDPTIRKNLAVACFASGDKATARRLMEGAAG